MTFVARNASTCLYACTWLHTNTRVNPIKAGTEQNRTDPIGACASLKFSVGLVFKHF